MKIRRGVIDTHVFAKHLLRQKAVKVKTIRIGRVNIIIDNKGDRNG